MDKEDRITATKAGGTEEKNERGLRPQNLQEYI